MSRLSEKAKLLSAADYDDDASSLHSDGDELTSSGSRSSVNHARHDREVLDSEEEREKLLAPESRTKQDGRSDGKVTISKWERRKLAQEARRERKRRKRGKDNELMYEMEEAGEPSDSGLSRSSSELDLQPVAVAQARASPRKRFLKSCHIALSITVLFLVLLYGAYRASSGSKKQLVPSLHSNGTHLFGPTTIIVSLDGFRADFLNRGLSPTLNQFIRDGVSPQYMLPSFPSVTFPNHYTLATGLYPESHGVVGNTFWDPNLQEHFECCDGVISLHPKWWSGEPIWATAEKQGLRAAIHMWPGSEAHIMGIEPAYVDKYNGSEVLSVKVDRVLNWLDLPGPDSPSAKVNEPRPQFIAMYVPVVDSDGHRYGPNSTEIRGTITQVDDMLHDLFTGLQQRNLTDIVNVVIVSDHGMATTSAHRLIQYEDLVDPDLIEHTDGWPLYGLRPKNLDHLEDLYNQLKKKAEQIPSIEVYLRDKDMPERYHFSKNERIAPLWVVPKAGWAIVKKDEFDVKQGLRDGLTYHPRGLHGYDFEHPLMRAIFVARGPAFPHQAGSKIEVFQNTNVYNIICDSLGIQPVPNNGTLRLPFKPVGLHSPDAPVVDTPVDPIDPMEKGSSAPIPPAIGVTRPAPIPTSPPSPETPAQRPVPVSTVSIPSNGTSTSHSGQKLEEWWAWFLAKVEEAESWAKDKIGTGTTTMTEAPGRRA